MDTLESRHDIVTALKSGIVERKFDESVLNSMDADDQFAGLIWYVCKLDSNYNMFKVESHMILTLAIFLKSTHYVDIDFNENIISIKTDSCSFCTKWKTPNGLLSFLYLVREYTKYCEDDSYFYDDFRQATRAITDHLSEDHDPRQTWRDIIKLSKDFFKTTKYLE